MTTQSKVYISNLNYHTTEDELREYLVETKATNVFIPNYFVGFGSLKFKPLGIAYADLPTAEDAEGFIKEFEGKLFKDRKLKIKLHVPYTPTSKPVRLSSVQSIKRLSKKGSEEFKDNDKENCSVKVVNSSVERKYSEDSVFVKGLKAKTCEGDLKAIFEDYNPREINIFKPRGWIKGLKHRSHNAIITLDLPEKKTLEEVISSCTGERCCGNPIIVMRAYLNEDRGTDAKVKKEQCENLVDAINDQEDAETKKIKKAEAAEVNVDAEEECEIKGAFADEASPDEIENRKDESTDPTMQSFEQENASKKAIHEGSGGLEERPDCASEAKAGKAQDT